MIPFIRAGLASPKRLRKGEAGSGKFGVPQLSCEDARKCRERAFAACGVPGVWSCFLLITSCLPAGRYLFISLSHHSLLPTPYSLLPTPYSLLFPLFPLFDFSTPPPSTCLLFNPIRGWDLGYAYSTAGVTAATVFRPLRGRHSHLSFSPLPCFAVAATHRRSGAYCSSLISHCSSLTLPTLPTLRLLTFRLLPPFEHQPSSFEHPSALPV